MAQTTAEDSVPSSIYQDGTMILPPSLRSPRKTITTDKAKARGAEEKEKGKEKGEETGTALETTLDRSPNFRLHKRK
ncbi:hypothetical protein QCA50_004823 [Cerrena zonata]|uniref:Uncharacterized protein n=1 Tax=Cerrena zonata TaxID=2478898 RepID=A0AAW0GHZ0_9APHY